MKRDNSLLTEEERDFLRATDKKREEKYIKQQRYYHRRNIRNRIENGVLDLALAAAELSEAQIADFDVSESDWIEAYRALGTLSGRVVEYPPDKLREAAESLNDLADTIED